MKSTWIAVGALIRRDIRVAFQRWGELGLPLVFFTIVVTLFPLALSPTPELLRNIGPGVLWVAALLASLLAMDTLFRNDMDDGSLEQLALSPHPLALLVLARTLTHWMLTGLPLVILSPVLAQGFYLPPQAVWTLVICLLLATPTLSLLGSMLAALTISLRRGSGILGILVLPLALPLLIFGARATDMAAQGENVAGPLYLLTALLVMALILAPVAAAAALRVSID